MCYQCSIITLGLLLLGGFAAGSAKGAASIAPDDLRSESLIDPQGIDVIQPRLSWALAATSSTARGLTQSAYEVEVASSPEQLVSGHGDLWDTGKVSSAESINIRYAGTPLQSLQPCFWQVMVWDEAGAPSAWSKPARWSMGLLQQDDWKGEWIGRKQPDVPGQFGAKWIWYPEGQPELSAPVATRYFRRLLVLPIGKKLESAVLRFTADNEATLSINGRKVATEDDFHVFCKVDVAALLRPGENIIAARVRNTGGAPNPAGFIAQIDVKVAGADPVTLSTDANWKTSTAPQTGWDAVGFDDKQWVAAKVLGSDGMSPWGKIGSDSRVLPARQLRREFTVEKVLRRAVVCYSGLGWSELYMNGKKVGNEVLSPPLSDYSRREFYVTHDVTSLVRQGANAMGVWLGNGRYYAPRLSVPAPTTTYGLPALKLQMHLEYTDGTSADVVSDRSWKATTDGPILANNEYDGEEYDARREPGKWSDPQFDDTKWQSADVMPNPGGKLVATMIDPTRVVGTLKPVSVNQVKPGIFVFNMGQNFAGWCKLHVEGPAGTRVSLRHAERLNPDGTLYTANLRSAEATDIYTLKGNGPETYEPRFTLHGFQYVEITGYPGVPSLSSIEGQIVSDDLEIAGEFKCSNALINQICQNVFWGTRSNYRSIVTDCCQRDERQGWLGDRNEESRGESYLFNNGKLYAKWVGDMVDSQRPDGVISDVCPDYWKFYGNSVTWPSSMIIIPGMLMDQYADSSVLDRAYPAMVKWMDQMQGNIKDGVVSRDDYGDWCMPPANLREIHSGDPARQTSGPLIATAYFFRCLKLMSRYATILHKPEDASRYEALALELQKGMNDHFYKPGQGQYDNGSATSSVLPLAFDMVPQDQQCRVVQHLVDTIVKTNHGHIPTGLIGCQWINTVLARNGHPELPCTMATQTTYPGLGYMISQHATTIWELWNGNTADPAMNSGNHVMLVGDLCKYLYEDIAGIRPDPLQPGFKHVIMSPSPVADLTSASATHRSAYGVVSSAWNRKGDAFHWDITIPPNTTATLFLPGGSVKEVTESGRPAAQAAGLKFVEIKNGRAEFNAGSGTYHLLSRWPNSSR